MNDPHHAARYRPAAIFRRRYRIELGILMAALLALTAGCAVSPPDTLGLANGRLAPCPGAPHCVCSESTEAGSIIAPLTFGEEPSISWSRAAEAVQTIGGTIVTQQDNYLHATFTTPLLRFVDDLELRLDADAGLIHVRSSSRIGYYDFNVNRKRVERLRNAFAG
jgi:uncharacterized protein (DUF1499 family)